MALDTILVGCVSKSGAVGYFYRSVSCSDLRVNDVLRVVFVRPRHVPGNAETWKTRDGDVSHSPDTILMHASTPNGDPSFVTGVVDTLRFQ